MRIERRERLVEQQHAGVACERASERDPLVLAAGELRGQAQARCEIAEALEQLLRPRLACVGDVLRDRHVREKRV